MPVKGLKPVTCDLASDAGTSSASPRPPSLQRFVEHYKQMKINGNEKTWIQKNVHTAI
jgi:hypothetical protein